MIVVKDTVRSLGLDSRVVQLKFTLSSKGYVKCFKKDRNVRMSRNIQGTSFNLALTLLHKIIFNFSPDLEDYT